MRIRWIIVCLLAGLVGARAEDAALIAAVRSGDLARLQQLAGVQPGVLSAADADGNTALQTALEWRQVELARWLLALPERTAFVTNVNLQGRTPLHLAAKNGLSALVPELAQDPATVDVADSAGRTPLHLAAWLAGSNSVDTVASLLAAGADPSLTDKEGQTPFLMAATAGNLGAAELLLATNSTVLNLADHKGRTALHQAAFFGRADMVAVLLDAGADVNAKDQSGRTPLFMAVSACHADVVEQLLEHGARMDIRDNYGKTPLRISMERPCDEASDTLVRAGARE